MPLLALARFVTTLVSLVILSAAGYLLWSWYDGAWVRDASGAMTHVREPWRLWTGGALLVWSFLGRFIVPLLVARRDVRPSRPVRGQGEMIASPTGASLYVETHGQAGSPPLIFTHGWGMDSTYWSYAKAELADRFRLVVWDLPGLGKSRSGGPDGVRLEAFATDLAAVVEFAGRQAPVLVGHSIGGMTIQTLLRDRPEIQSRLAGVVLLNTTYTNPLRTMIAAPLLLALQRPLLEPVTRLMIWLQPLVWLSKWQSYLSGSAQLGLRLGFGRFATRSQLNHCALLSTRNPPAVQARGDLAMFHWDATDALQGLRIPALVIGGDKDIVTKPEASRAIAGENATSRVEMVADVNHMGPMERADIYNSLIAEFALSVQPGAALDVRRPRGRAARTEDHDIMR